MAPGMGSAPEVRTTPEIRLPEKRKEPLGERLSGYFHYHGAKGGLLLMLDRKREARECFDRAIALANTAAEAAHIRMHLDRLIAESEKSARA